MWTLASQGSPKLHLCHVNLAKTQSSAKPNFKRLHFQEAYFKMQFLMNLSSRIKQISSELNLIKSPSIDALFTYRTFLVLRFEKQALLQQSSLQEQNSIRVTS